MSTINDYKKHQEATNKEIFALDMWTNLRWYSPEKMEEWRKEYTKAKAETKAKAKAETKNNQE